MICSACHAWMQPILDKAAEIARCPECGHEASRRFWPLFIVTGPSGAGKTAMVPYLQRLLPRWEVFETDILWDSGRDWNIVKCNWLRIADSLVQRPHPRPTILCGTIQPEDIEACDVFPFFRCVHWLALVCEAETLTARLRARPAWRGCDEAFIFAQRTYLQWLHEHALTAFAPPLTLLDTTHTPLEQTAEQIQNWATSRWPDGSEALFP